DYHCGSYRSGDTYIF
nr:immunoglobulin light chain junction region [Macaca mulatta]